MVGNNENDFREVEKRGNRYVVVDERDLPKKPIMLETQIEQRKFPYYNRSLARYAGGRYDMKLGKPSYKDMPWMINYYEMEPLSREKFEIYLEDPISKLKENRKITEGEALKLYQHEKKFDFTYILSEKATSIFNRLKWIYLEALKKMENSGICLEQCRVPNKVVNDKVIYIDDTILKSGNIVSLAAGLGAQGILDDLEEMNAGSYKEWFIPVKKLRSILNSILGENNWTVETTSSKSIDKTHAVVRGYYVDMLGNFMYGQLVTDITFGNTSVDKDTTLQSKLERAMITSIFPALHGLSETEYYKEVKNLKQNIMNAAIEPIMIEAYKNLYPYKQIEGNQIKPMKRPLSEVEVPSEKRYIENIPDDEPKEISVEKKT